MWIRIERSAYFATLLKLGLQLVTSFRIFRRPEIGSFTEPRIVLDLLDGDWPSTRARRRNSTLSLRDRVHPLEQSIEVGEINGQRRDNRDHGDPADQVPHHAHRSEFFAIREKNQRRHRQQNKKTRPVSGRDQPENVEPENSPKQQAPTSRREHDFERAYQRHERKVACSTSGVVKRPHQSRVIGVTVQIEL